MGKKIEIRKIDAATFREQIKRIKGEMAEPKANPVPEKTVDIGMKLSDGTVFAGVSPDTGHPMYVTPQDSLADSFQSAVHCKNELNGNTAYGHDDWRLPSKTELAVLRANKDKGCLKDTFNSNSLYWSSSVMNDMFVTLKRFSDGDERFYIPGRDLNACVRCVR